MPAWNGYLATIAATKASMSAARCSGVRLLTIRLIALFVYSIRFFAASARSRVSVPSV